MLTLTLALLPVLASAAPPPPQLGFVQKPMKHARTDHVITVLGDGRALVTGGFVDDGREFSTPKTVEVFDPRTGAWSTVAPMKRGRRNHVANLLPDGRVLVTGGSELTVLAGSRDWVQSDGELWDPVRDRWTVAPRMHEPRRRHAGVTLTDGRVLLAGGESAGPALSAELFDPATDKFARAGNLGRPRIYHAMVALPRGSAAIVGGISIDTVTTTAGPVTTITPTHDLLDTIELWDPSRNAWGVGPRLVEARANPTVTVLPDGKLLVVGGELRRTFSASAELCDLAAGTCVSAGALATPRTVHTATLLPDGRVIVIGGETGSVATPHQVSSVEAWHPRTGWTVLGDIVRARHDHAAALLPTGQILISGGEGCGKGCEKTTASTEVVVVP